MNKVCVIGSINMDFVIDIKDVPKEGDTVVSENLDLLSGGKGSNQAIASSRSGSLVSMIGKVGNDENGKKLLEIIKNSKVNIDGIIKEENMRTGIATVMISSNGNNTIIVNSGSNMELKKEEILNNREVIKSSDIILTQLETPSECAFEGFKIAKENEKITILNPAPAVENLDDKLLRLTDIIVPNKKEAESLTGVKIDNKDNIRKSADFFIKKGVEIVIFTLGKDGLAICNSEEIKIIKAKKVKVVDTTGAGDTFIGAFSSEIIGLDFENVIKAAEYGMKASAISVTIKGAEPSIPFRNEIEKA